MKRQFRGLAAVLAVVTVAGFSLAACGSQHASATGGSGPYASQVDSLLSKMTLEEKVGQMTLLSVSRLWGSCSGGGPGADLNSACLQEVLIGKHVGAILSGGGEAPAANTPRAWAEMTNAIQRYAIQHSRLHIPVLYGVDAVHGHNNVQGAMMFPQNLGMAATWDPTIVQSAAAATARAVHATGIHWTYSPVADLGRDIRWGRYYETFGEDPILASRMVAADVQGYQGKSYSTGVSATLKHYIGYSEPLNGHDRTEAQLPLRYLREMYYPSFQSGVSAGAGTVMANSGSVNGVPVHASHYLLTDVLRGQMGFKGMTVTDWQDIQSLYSSYHYASSMKDAIRLSINAGIDMSMVPYDADTFTSDLISLVKEGKVPQSRIDDAVRHILTLKYALGLFKHPYVDATQADAQVLNVASDASLARKAVRESVTLLKNEGSVLPLHNVHSILVAGPGADSVRDQMGGWTLAWQGVPEGSSVPGVTVLQGIKNAAHGASVTYAATADEAGAAAKKADVNIVVLSEHPYAEGLGDTETALPSDDQIKLADAVLASGKPTVLVILAGRPLLVTPQIDAAQGVLMAYLPGTEAGNGIADVLFGKADPSGRLPFSWPKRMGQVPMFYQRLPGTYGVPTSNYDPEFPFGAGLSYTDFAFSSVQASAPSSRNGTVKVQVDASNLGSRSGAAVVQVYVHPENAPILVPDRKLVAFARVSLKAGERKTVSLSFPTSELAVIPGDITGTEAAVVEPGTYTLTVGTSSTQFTLH